MKCNFVLIASSSYNEKNQPQSKTDISLNLKLNICMLDSERCKAGWGRKKPKKKINDDSFLLLSDYLILFIYYVWTVW